MSDLDKITKEELIQAVRIANDALIAGEGRDLLYYLDDLGDYPVAARVIKAVLQLENKG